MTTGRIHELALPAGALGALRRALVAELGTERAAQVLHAAGHAAGDELFRTLTPKSELSQLPAAEFWRRLNQLFAARGWGALTHEPVHPGVGALSSTDWGEAGPAGTSGRPGCFFTTGLLANLLGAAAGNDIAVMEVECRSRGDVRCRFLFGSPATLDQVYQRLAVGENPDLVLAQLG